MEIILDNVKNKSLNINMTINSNHVTGITGNIYKEVLHLINLDYYVQGKLLIDKVKVDKRNYNKLKEKISYVDFELKKELSLIAVREYMEYIMQEKLIKVKDSKKKIIDSIKIVGLNQTILDKNINVLAKSEVKLIQIAIALLSNPEIIILDDPFKFLDLKNSKKLYMLLLKLKEQYKKVIIIGSNDSNILYKYTDKIVFLKNNQVLLEGDTKLLYEKVSYLKKNKFEIPDIVKFTYKAKKKKIKIDYHKDIRDLIKDIYKHV